MVPVNRCAILSPIDNRRAVLGVILVSCNGAALGPDVGRTTTEDEGMRGEGVRRLEPTPELITGGEIAFVGGDSAEVVAG